MSWENDATGYLAELSRQTGGQQPATIGQVWDSEWKRGSLDTIGGVGQPFGDARQDLVTAIETASGRPIEDYAAQMGVRLGSGVTQAEDIRLLGSLADTLPEEHRKKIEPLKDIRLNAARKAQKIEADADEIGNATYGLSGVATAFIAGVARQAADPVNVAAMVATAPLGAARGASLLATIGREAGANAAAQVAIEPVIEPQRERLGLESGFGRAATNVLEAGIGGGVLSGLFHVAGRGLRTLRGERPAEAAGAPAPAEGAIVPPEGVERAAEPAAAPVARPDPVPAGPLTPAGPAEQFAPDDFHAAGDLAERDHVIDVMAPNDTAEAKLDHAAEVEVVARRIDSVERIEPPQRMQLVRDQFGENTSYKGAGDIHSYSINGPDGSNVGFAEFAIDGNTARVLDISSFAFNGDRELYGNVRNSLGTRQMRDLLSQFRELHPEVEKLTADRVSGARKRGAYDAGVASTEIEVSLPPRRSEMAATLEGRADAAESLPEAAAPLSQPPRPGVIGDWVTAKPEVYSNLERQGAKTYKGMGEEINGYLRTGKTEASMRPITEAIEALDQAFQRSILTADATVFRGVTDGPFFDWPDSMVGSIYVEKGYLSTSLLLNEAENFTSLKHRVVRPAFFEIEMPKGMPAINMDGMPPRDTMASELLFPRGLELRINGIERTDPNLLVIQMKAELPAAAKQTARTGLADTPLPEQYKIAAARQPLGAAPPKTRRGRNNADPETWSLNEFLASKGGLKPDPELSAIFGTEKGPFVPGFGLLVRKNGRSLDDALTMAKEAGYLFDARDLDGPDNGTLGRAGRTGMGLTPNDLLDRLDAESRGQKTYRHGRAAEVAIDDGQEAHAIVGALEKELYDTGGGDIRVDQAIADRVVQIVRQEKETDLLSAYERAIMEDRERYQGLARARRADAELAEIPGWDVDDAGSAPRDGAADPGQRGQAGMSGQGDVGQDGSAARDAGQGAGAPRQLGDQALAADAARVLEEAGGDLEITLQNPDGTTRTLKASDALREVEDDARAADELNACIAGAAEEPPF